MDRTAIKESIFRAAVATLQECIGFLNDQDLSAAAAAERDRLWMLCWYVTEQVDALDSDHKDSERKEV